MTGRGSKNGRVAVGPLPWLMWSLGALFFCYAFFQRVAPSVLVGDLMRDFGVGAAVLGNLSAFYFYAYAGMQLPLGVLVDTWGPSSPIFLALSFSIRYLGSPLEILPPLDHWRRQPAIR